MTACPRVLTYAPYSFTGRGPAESCASIVAGFPQSAGRVEVFAARFRKRVAGSAQLHESLPPWLRHLPWRLVAQQAIARLNEQFRASLETADPIETIAYFWPGPPVELVEFARDRGITTVREMINSACATSGPILDAAYARLGLPATHLVTPETIATETRELQEYDYFFASNPEVEASLMRLDVTRDQILPTTFGWNPERFSAPSHSPARGRGIRVLFVGEMNVRKGVPELVEAWQAADVEGELVLAGAHTPAISDLLRRAGPVPRITEVGYVDDLASLFHGCDIFAFPTHEEGGPQVTYEAAACGLPIITTSMGAARLVESGSTGLIVEAGSVAQLVDAIRLLASRADLRETYGANARQRSLDFTYPRVAAQRWSQLLYTLDRHS
jgi:glycosyltransferase involved in cell wall biosynthesis